jgi:hypothetical protein
MTPEQIQQEINKCYEDPVYFYNTYTTQGRQHPVTQEHYEVLIKLANSPVILRGRRGNWMEIN